MILCLRADDVLESGGWYFGKQRMMFWCGRMIFTYAKKMIFTSYTYYFLCNALGFNKLLVVCEPFLPTTILLPNPILFGIFAIFLSKKGFNRKQNFHPLEKMFLPIGNSASIHWKGCFQTLETNRVDNDEKLPFCYAKRKHSAIKQPPYKRNLSAQASRHLPHKAMSTT